VSTLVSLSLRWSAAEIEGNYYASLGPEAVDRPDAREQALKAAEEGSVLLKNDGILPLNLNEEEEESSGSHKPVQKLAFIGPQANFTQDMLSAPQYHGQNTLVNSHSPLLVAQRRGWDVTYTRGCVEQPNDRQAVALFSRTSLSHQSATPFL
jgi:beta-D-xylosidase 4